MKIFKKIWVYPKGLFLGRKYWEGPEEGKKNCMKIMSGCKEEFCFLGGEGNSRFMEDEEIKERMQELIDEEIKIRFLFGPHYDVKSVAFLRWAKEGKVEMRWLNTREEEHFKVVDRGYIQVSLKHEALEEERNGYIAFSVKEAQEKYDYFELLWEKAELFDPVKRIEEAENGCVEFERIFRERKPVERYKDCQWGIDAGLIKKEKEGSDPVPVTEDDIRRLKNKIFIPIISPSEAEERALKEMKAFLGMEKELLKEYSRGRFVAVLGGKVVADGDDEIELAMRVYEEQGYFPMYIGRLGVEPEVIEVSSLEGSCNDAM